MSTYLELVIQERSSDGHSILTHRHFHITHPSAGELANVLSNMIAQAAHTGSWAHQTSDPLRPCSICWQIAQEEKHDRARSRPTKAR